MGRFGDKSDMGELPVVKVSAFSLKSIFTLTGKSKKIQGLKFNR